MSKNASEMLLVRLKEKGIPYAFWQAVIEVQEEAEKYGIMHYDVNLKYKLEVLREEQRKIVGEEIHGALAEEQAIRSSREKEGSS